MHFFAARFHCCNEQMDLTSEHFRAYVFLELKRGRKPFEILEQLRETGLDNIPSQSTICRWCKDFTEGTRTSVKDAPREGRPRTSSSDPSIARVKDMIFREPKLSTRQLAELLDIPHSSIHQILTEELLLTKVCSVWVPHMLSPQNKEARVAGATALRSFLSSHPDNELLRQYVTEDETWIFFQDIHPKQENKTWLAPGQPRQQVCRQQLTDKKTMLLVAFTCDGKFNVDVTGKNDPINAERYSEFVHSTGDRWRVLRSDPLKLSQVWWQHDNARPHTAALTTEFFERRGIETIKQPPYSPDLNLADRFLFKHLKKELRKSSYSTAEEVKVASLQVLRAIPKERLATELNKLKRHCHLVITQRGNYITP